MDKRPGEKGDNKYVSLNTTCQIILQVPDYLVESDLNEQSKLHLLFKESDLHDPSQFALQTKENEKYPLFDGRTCINVQREKKSPPKSSLKVKGSSRSRSTSCSDREEINVSPRRNWNYRSRHSPLNDSVKNSKIVKEYPENLRGSEKITSSLEQHKVYDGRDNKSRHLENNIIRHNKSHVPVRKVEIDPEYYQNRSCKSKDGNYKEKSPKLEFSRHSRESNANDGRHRDHKIFEDCRYKCSNKRHERSRSQSSTRIRELSSGSCDKDKYYRTSSLSLRRCKSPSTKRRSRSPYYQSRTSPHSRRDNYSPNLKRTSPRRFSPINKSRRERYDYLQSDRKQASTRSSYGSRSRRQSRSPDYRKYASSQDIESGYARQSCSPYQTNPNKHRPLQGIYKDSESEVRDRYKSPVGLQHNHQSLPIDYNYYGAEPFWLTGPLPPGPGYMPRGFMSPSMPIPPALIHPPYMTPRPFMPMLPPMRHQFRHRFPNMYSRQPRPKVITSITASTSNVTNTGNVKAVDHPTVSAIISKSPTSVLINSTVEESLVEIKNIGTVESENIEKTVQNKD